MVCAFQQIVYTDLIQISQRTQNGRRYHSLTAFVIGICSLGHIDSPTNFRLCQIRVFPQRANSQILFHIITGYSI